MDTSALIGILFGEPESDACTDAVQDAERILISGATLAEALIVAARKGFGPQMQRLIEKIGPDVIALRRTASQFSTPAHPCPRCPR
ncbi:PIN domain-containing protein [Jiella mangrovi]|uniref:PIN domain-containing protein n=1 Tax=Jiella mangrovi TaxID=2821407 RepID=UPI003CC91880